MATLSLCMIVKNEEDTLERCLSSVKDALDEIVIVDTGSTDATKKTASRFTNKIFDFKWCDDFAAARNYAFSKASQTYVMWLDADDVITPENLEILKTLKETVLDGKTPQVIANYDVAFDENGNPSMTYVRERIFLRSLKPVWLGAVHEVIALLSDAYYSGFTVSHKKMRAAPVDRNLKIYEKMIENGDKLDARQKYYYARELYYNSDYVKAAEKLIEFLGDPDGWVENKISACLDLSRCYVKIGQKLLAVDALLKSFEYDVPRAEHCCELASLYMEENKLDQAVFWYKSAMYKKYDASTGAFISPDCYGYIPAIQLCVCYDRKGERKAARGYNELAAFYKPDSISVKNNRKYFDSLD